MLLASLSALAYFLTMFEAYQLSQGVPQTICVGPSVGTAGTDTETIVTMVEVYVLPHSALAGCGGAHSCARL